MQRIPALFRALLVHNYGAPPLGVFYFHDRRVGCITLFRQYLRIFTHTIYFLYLNTEWTLHHWLNQCCLKRSSFSRQLVVRRLICVVEHYSKLMRALNCVDLQFVGSFFIFYVGMINWIGF